MGHFHAPLPATVTKMKQVAEVMMKDSKEAFSILLLYHTVRSIARGRIGQKLVTFSRLNPVTVCSFKNWVQNICPSFDA